MGSWPRETACLAQTTCGKGQKLSEASSTSLGSCVSCDANTYQDAEQAHRKVSCADQTTCDVGQYISEDSKEIKRTCHGCAAGTYQDESSNRETDCKPQPACEAGSGGVQQTDRVVGFTVQSCTDASICSAKHHGAIVVQEHDGASPLAFVWLRPRPERPWDWLAVGPHMAACV